MLKMKFIKKELVNWFNIHGDNVIFLIFHLNFIFFLNCKTCSSTSIKVLHH